LSQIYTWELIFKRNLLVKILTDYMSNSNNS
jgi:hypothetical protein